VAKNISAIIILLSFLLAHGLVSAGIDGAVGKDPTLPDYMNSGEANHYIKKSSLKRSDYELSMIMHDKSRKIAVINNKIKSEEEYIAGARIAKINKNSVVLWKSGERIELNLIKGHGRN